jgi:hypothetical protein
MLSGAADVATAAAKHARNGNNTLLMLLCMSYKTNINMVNTLLDNGADTKLLNNNMTAYDYAVDNNNHECNLLFLDGY